jgi:hypothetical protein
MKKECYEIKKAIHSKFVSVIEFDMAHTERMPEKFTIIESELESDTLETFEPYFFCAFF